MVSKFYFLAFVFLLAVAGCSDASDNQQPQEPVLRYSQLKVCEFAENLAQLDVSAPSAKQLRFLNEQWRTLQQDNALRPAEAEHLQHVMSALNYHLARDSLARIQEVLAHTERTYEQIEGLRRFSSNPKEMKVPDSIIRNLRNAVQDCCADALSRNASALLREDEESARYAIGRRAYFIQRDVNRILNNELTFTAYRERLQQAAAELPDAPAPIDVSASWVTCRST
ncbi:hypothetical protein [Pseudidiomarina terrestris]|uniref:Lipoprotein n=1 Tax=Pseudidiomarina terrestris TaxID=2820060 RepID=A0AAW7R515_9GAMM|nr:MULTISPECIES: hypothetical protein [unclassified Pseudidiomarina]MDN7125614.1 hypothetical protein [Pseudidiomarina sp. 1APP75-32.1]MDN7130522.1 hypothetical protein [Pseudidiomarina sp. 1APR75-15]MDN7134164.1 hypothetical protein [Pseudidiomarina sp. 1ASP75-5]MDN7137149.1 hypothetical protein [Pseudidiomarina sp. 1ASP75-14]MEA3588447.1 hypothetical protein [Pseudidiomarina sp. 1APP75-27a]